MPCFIGCSLHYRRLHWCVLVDACSLRIVFCVCLSVSACVVRLCLRRTCFLTTDAMPMPAGPHKDMLRPRLCERVSRVVSVLPSR